MVVLPGTYGFGASLSGTLIASLLCFASPSRLAAQDDLAGGVARLQDALDQIVGDGTFDIADEEFCRNVLWTNFVLLDQSNMDTLSSLTNENFGVMHLTA